MDVAQILVDWLESHEYTGLYNPYRECDCSLLHGLLPCGSLGEGDCLPGYRWECNKCPGCCPIGGEDRSCARERTQEKFLKWMHRCRRMLRAVFKLSADRIDQAFQDEVWLAYFEERDSARFAVTEFMKTAGDSIHEES